ncbi:ABC transporter ATP-binding protein [Bacillus solimangrovi]|uniref:Bacitracin ABC transporter ATP-binding protein n=1 Tax=Bacillus solimangrovi TaxID=1305675 RepID=A0A1E5LFE6_9BACI|nr:ABC transporter ATP-binding protein [Bacillus solimangrovi]OEH92799.1 bacitracin ABC transporter ATP-binding protein [Bacillus solimangrovi]
MTENILSARNVTKKYGSFNALDNVSIEIQSGEFVGIMGSSGSGKTSLLNLLSTIDTVSNGEIYINGQNIVKLNDNKKSNFRRDNLGFIFQEYFLLDSLTIQENIAISLTLLKKTPKEIEGLIYTLAARFGIEKQLSKYPNELSGGQKQRVAAARAIIKEPSILFADEPTGALDSNSARELLMKLKEVNEDLNTTILMVTHDAYSASFANRIIILKDGHTVNELRKGKKRRKEFFEEILEEIANLEYR